MTEPHTDAVEELLWDQLCVRYSLCAFILHWWLDFYEKIQVVIMNMQSLPKDSPMQMFKDYILSVSSFYVDEV